MNHHRLIAAAILVITITSIPGFAQPRFTRIPTSTLLGGSPLHIPLNGIAPEGQALTYTAVSSDSLVTPTVISGNRGLRMRGANSLRSTPRACPRA